MARGDDSDRERHRPRRQSRDPESDRERIRSSEHRKRRTHRATDSQGELLPRNGDRNSRGNSPQKKRHGVSKSGSSSTPLSLDSLARLDALNQRSGWKGFDDAYLQEVRNREGRMEKERRREEKEVDRERRRAERRAEREEQRRLEEIEQQRELEAERQRAREEEREIRREQKRREREIDQERQRDDQDRRHDKQVMREPQRYVFGRQHEVETPVDEDYSDAEGYKKHEIDEYWAKRTRYEQQREQRRAEGFESDYRSKKKKSRVVSGALLEEGSSPEKQRRHHEDKRLMDGSGGNGTEYTSDTEWRKKRNTRICESLQGWHLSFTNTHLGICIAIAVLVVALAISIPVGVFVGKKNSNSSSSSNSTKPANSNLNGISESSIPSQYQGTYLDPFTWYDTTDFNVTFTDVMIGGLPIMGLNSTWDDTTQANSGVPPLDQSFDYGTTPIRGINVGGWLSIEPFITPSLFEKFSSRNTVIDEWTLTSALGSDQAKSTLEEHYSSFINAQSFADIKAAGFDHVRIPFSYWAVTTYSGDPYVENVSWRYLLRGIEYCRWNGLRVNLDLHGLPGSQNGWNHSGRQGVIGWLNGTDGDVNAQRSLDIHNQLSTFFAQPRYKNIITLYGLVNEPRMTGLDTDKVLNWTTNAVSTVRGNNITAIIVFGDGFLGLDNWQGKLQNESNLLLDVHQYVIFNNGQISLNHSAKLEFACSGWTAQMQRSQNKATGFGPTLCGEWSQADTDCALYLNDVGVGSRWEGTMNTGNASTQVLSPQCPTNNSPTCECNDANADPSQYSSAYKQWLLDFAEAQMESFEAGWGWFYWTWATESAPQWSYQQGMAAGILPTNVAQRQFSCNGSISNFAAMGLPENY